jgi:hypothetical protein
MIAGGKPEFTLARRSGIPRSRRCGARPLRRVSRSRTRRGSIGARALVTPGVPRSAVLLRSTFGCHNLTILAAHRPARRYPAVAFRGSEAVISRSRNRARVARPACATPTLRWVAGSGCSSSHRALEHLSGSVSHGVGHVGPGRRRCRWKSRRHDGTVRTLAAAPAEASRRWSARPQVLRVPEGGVVHRSLALALMRPGPGSQALRALARLDVSRERPSRQGVRGSSILRA